MESGSSALALAAWKRMSHMRMHAAAWLELFCRGAVSEIV